MNEKDYFLCTSIIHYSCFFSTATTQVFDSTPLFSTEFIRMSDKVLERIITESSCKHTLIPIYLYLQAVI